METGSLFNLEKRNFPRIEDTIFFLYNYSESVINITSASIQRCTAFTRDISVGGLMFETETSIFEKGNEFELELYQPLNCDKTVVFCMPILAKVIWMMKIEKEHFEIGENQYRTGIQFLEIKGQDRQKITNYVDAILEKNVF
jgi:c-di-GMP-binding flagellar brake protein YcgR